MRTLFRSCLSFAIMLSFFGGLAAAQAPKPPVEPKPKGAPLAAPRPKDPKAPDKVATPPTHHPHMVMVHIPCCVYVCPPPRCGLFARLFGRCGGCEPWSQVVYVCGPVYYIHPAPPAGKPAQPMPKTPKPITPARSAVSLYSEGRSFYWDGDAKTARDLLSAAVERDSQDVGIWYFKALAERALGDETAAQESARRGAALERLGADRTLVGLTLERVQGDERRFLRSAMTADLTFEKAQQLAATPVKVAATGQK